MTPADRSASAERNGEPASVVAQFRDRMNRIRERELTTALKRLPGLTPHQRAAVEYLSRALMNEFVDAPSVRLHAAAANQGASGVIDAARYLFALGGGETADASGADVAA